MKNILLKILYAILRCEAKIILAIKKPEVIAITGSVGKTSTKDAIAHIMGDKFSIEKSPGNLNAEVGIPLTILGYEKEETLGKFGLIFSPFWGLLKIVVIAFSRYPKILIIEMGAEHKGDIKTFTKLAKPKIGVVTAVSSVHLVNFGNVEGVFEEKADLVRSIPKKGTVVLNEKDSRVAKMAKLTKANVKYFTAEPRDIYKEAAIKVGEIYGISKDTSEKKLVSFKMPKGRMNIIRKKDFTIIDDSYNSNPLAARAALSELAKMQGKRKVAILGDMLEQGDYTEKVHKEIGELAGEVCGQVYFVGEHADLFEEGAKNKLDSKYIKKYKDANEAARDTSRIIKPGDVILIKGSRGIGLEIVVEKIMKGA